MARGEPGEHVLPGDLQLPADVGAVRVDRLRAMPSSRAISLLVLSCAMSLRIIRS